MKPRRSGSTGSTWLEAALVIAIVGFVVIIVWPNLRRKPKKSVRSTCSINLRYIGLATALYADLYQKRCPTDAKLSAVGSFMLLTNVLTSAKIMHCPSDQRALSVATLPEINRNNLSYSYVPNLIWQSNPDSILALDRIYTTAKGSPWPKNGNHSTAGGNMVFLDGHVEFKPTVQFDLRDQSGKYIVLSP